ncbi:MAG: L-histidine N(alpha)-methyltransferase [Acidobacteriota bacterium]
MTSPAQARDDGPEPAASGDAAADIRDHLLRTPRQLPSRYLYDALGSALFDAICQLPWYPVTRGEMRLLEAHGGAILRAAGEVQHVVELGAGNGSKLAAVLTSGSVSAVRRQAPVVHLVDVSAAALATAAQAVTAVAPLRIERYEASYEHGLDLVRQGTESGRRLVLFLGSNIGNVDPDGARAFLRHVRHTLAPGDALLLGVDLVKPEADLLLAYDDPLGVTAAFDLNLLVRLNREFQADFDVASFRHRARWNAAPSRVEMHLVSTRLQRVRVPAARLEFTLRAGESIWTESSYKYSAAGVRALLVAGGFHVREQWIDGASQFALTLAGA